MKKNEITDLKTKTVDELRRQLLDLREEVAKMHTDRTLKKLTSTSLVKNKKKDIARVLTFLSMKQAIENVQSKVEEKVEEVKNG